MLSPKSLLLLTLAALTSAARLTISLPSSQLLPNPSTLPSSTHAILLGPPGIRYDAPIRRDNTFVFPDIPDASYLLTLHSRDYFFHPLRVDVSSSADEHSQTISAWQTFRGNEWSNKRPHYGTGQGDLTIQVRPVSQKDFYLVRGGFNLLAFFKSPMILMALGSAVLIFGMPYIMENMDPEAKAEFEEMQKKSPLMGSQGAANQLQNFDLASWMAGRSAPAEGDASTSSGGGGKSK